MSSYLPQTDADRQPAGDGFAVHHHVGLHAEVLLRAPRSETEPGVDFVEDQRHPHPVHNRAELAQPLGVARGGSSVLRTSLVSNTASLGGGELG